MRNTIPFVAIAMLAGCASPQQAMSPAKYLDTAIYVAVPENGDLPTIVERNGKRCVLRSSERCDLGDILVELP